MIKIWIIVWLSPATLCLGQPLWICQGLAPSCGTEATSSTTTQQKEDLSAKIEEMQSSLKSMEEEKMQQKQDLSEKIKDLQINIMSLKKEKKQQRESLSETIMEFFLKFFTKNQKEKIRKDRMNILRKNYGPMGKDN